MFGYLRLLLAFLVLISHLGVTFYSLNPGVIAVVIFYILAGYVVSYLYNTIFSRSNSPLWAFYKDRFYRIFPLYLTIAAITSLFLLLTSYASPDFTLLKIIYNLSIIPLNYYMVIDSTILSQPAWCLIPPAWSLGTELQAYLLLPLALACQKTKTVLLILSFFIYLLANSGIINPDYFGYRLIAGVFFIFILGSAIQSNSSQDKKIIIIVWLSILLLVPVFSYYNAFSPTYTRETFIGLLMGLPLITLLSHSTIKLPFNAFFGSLSYAIFLSHFLAIWILENYSLMSDNNVVKIIQVTLITLLISLIGLFIEKNCHKNNT